MTAWKLPPRAKVYEALSAVADDRVHLLTETAADVTSSARDKTYRVEWSLDRRQFASNDNASFWQGYIGYPIIAALLELRVLQAPAGAFDHLAGIEWKKLNKQFKNDYDKAVDHVLSQLEEGEAAAIRTSANDIYEQLNGLHLERLASSLRPPKA